MKRKISVILLIVMMLVALQPVIAVHFCGGEIYSLYLLEDKAAKACCEEEIVVSEDYSCCVMEQPDNLAQHDNCNGCEDDCNLGCCDTKTIQINTDDFQIESFQINFNQSGHSFDIPWFAVEMIFNPYEPENNFSFLSDAFPSEGLFLKDVSINTFVCVYRI